MNNIILTFCISTYNNSNGIYGLVSNILSVDNDEIEVLVLDNASTDNTLETLRTITDKRLTLLSNTEKMGEGQLLLKKMNEAKGEYCFLLDEKDFIIANKIKMLFNLLKEENINILINKPIIFENSNSYLLEDENFHELNKMYIALTSFSQSSIIIKKEIINFEMLYSISEDMFTYYPHIYVLSTLLNYNIDLLHEDSFVTMSNYKLDDSPHYIEYINILSIWLTYSPIYEYETKVLLLQVLRTFLFIQYSFIIDKSQRLESIMENSQMSSLILFRESETFEQMQEGMAVIINDFFENISL